jgi:hypothetical protein
MVALISRWPLVSFFALAFALTWLLFLPWRSGGREGNPLVHLRSGARRIRGGSDDRGLDGGAIAGGDRAPTQRHARM